MIKPTFTWNRGTLLEITCPTRFQKEEERARDEKIDSRREREPECEKPLVKLG